MPEPPQRMSWSLNPDDNPELREMLRAQHSSEIRLRAELMETAIGMLFDGRGKTRRTVALARILNDAVEELRSLAELSWTPRSIRDMAWIARNLFELVVRYLYVRESDADLQALLDEQLRDEIDIYQGMKSLASLEGDDRWCDEQIRKVEELAAAGGHVVPKRPKPVVDLARAAGMEDEYRALFKLYSKWVHPTSWRLFAGDVQAGFLVGQARMTFVGRSQAYASLLLGYAIEDATATADAAGQPPQGAYDQPLPDQDEREEMPDTILDPGSSERMQRLFDELKELGIPDPPQSPDEWKHRRLL
jgi:hypothetical protein